MPVEGFHIEKKTVGTRRNENNLFTQRAARQGSRIELENEKGLRKVPVGCQKSKDEYKDGNEEKFLARFTDAKRNQNW